MSEETAVEAKRGPGRPRKEAQDSGQQMVEQKDPWEGRKRKRNRADLSSEAQLRLRAEKRPGFVRRWVNDADGRVQHFQENLDYEIARNEKGEAISTLVGSDGKGSGMRAYLMETPEDWYRESQEEKRSLIKDPSKMKEAQAGEGEYIPSDPRNGKPRKSAITDDKLR